MSELRKTRPDPRVKAWSDVQVSDRLFLSEVTVAEIRFGIERKADAKQRAALETWLDQELRPWFQGRVLPVDEDVILEWCRLVARGRERNITFSQPDLFMAATARVHGLTLATRNERDFRHTDVRFFNPWSG